jgi:hypothetical protein
MGKRVIECFIIFRAIAAFAISTISIKLYRIWQNRITLELARGTL